MRLSMATAAHDVLTLLAVRPHVAIAHHIPGRIRLRFDPLAVASAIAGERLRALLARICGIVGTELNLPARSLVVTYDPQALAPATWERLLAAEAEDAARLVESLLAPDPAGTVHAP
jgi:hypothetical protein